MTQNRFPGIPPGVWNTLRTLTELRPYELNDIPAWTDFADAFVAKKDAETELESKDGTRKFKLKWSLETRAMTITELVPVGGPEAEPTTIDLGSDIAAWLATTK
ncbi:MAG: hypothetical protein WCG97_01180 [bacterium]